MLGFVAQPNLQTINYLILIGQINLLLHHKNDILIFSNATPIFMTTEKFLNEYLRKQQDNLYPKVLIPHGIQAALTTKPKLKTAEKFGSLSFLAGAIGVISLATPIGWLGLLGAGAAIIYDSTEGYREREIQTNKENENVKKILSDPLLLQEYMQNKITNTLNLTQSNLIKTDARLGKYDNTLLDAVKGIPECFVKNGEGLNLSYTFTPDVIIHVPSLNLWIDVEVDEPWFLNDLGQREPIHYIGKDDYRDRQFLNANWVVFRFAEEQVAKQPNSCAKEIAKFLLLFDMNVMSKFQNIPNLKTIQCWNNTDAVTISRY
ncbi:hypothetical protein BMF77_01949 [Dolichospermum sp. UHCC 0315A]|jgi:hypothetical protein|nr:hypothetical protein BMF77_01949 [Dolichospermum sp. UHCC 0315A]